MRICELFGLVASSPFFKSKSSMYDTIRAIIAARKSLKLDDSVHDLFSDNNYPKLSRYFKDNKNRKNLELLNDYFADCSSEYSNENDDSESSNEDTEDNYDVDIDNTDEDTDEDIDEEDTESEDSHSDDETDDDDGSIPDQTVNIILDPTLFHDLKVHTSKEHKRTRLMIGTNIALTVGNLVLLALKMMRT